MRAAVVEAHGKPLVVKQLPDPQPGAGEIVVRVNACGVCHSDLHIALGDWGGDVPRIPGHEAAGVVAEIGPEVHHLKPGDRVGIPWLYSACGRCEYCLDGWETFCPQQRGTALDVDGGFATHAIAPADWVARLPASLSDDLAAPTLCGGVTAYKGLKVSGLHLGQTAAVFGVGGLGHFGVQYARAMGARVIAFDVSDYALKLAADVGAHEVVDLRETPVAKAKERFGGAHVAVTFTPAPQAARDALAMLRPMGTFVAVGISPGTLEANVFDLTTWGYRITGSNVGSRKDVAEALALVADGTVKPVIKTRPLDAINEIFAEMREGRLTTGRYVLTM